MTALAWALLLCGLWLWGRDVADVPRPVSGPTTGDMAAVGRPFTAALPAAHEPLAGRPAPRRVLVPALGVDAPVAARGLDASGAVEPPPFDRPSQVGWYGAGTAPGAAGPAILVGHVDTASRPAVFHDLSAAEPGHEIRVERADGTVAEFTVDDVAVVERDGFDAHAVYGPHRAGRAELRLITCGGTYDRAAGTYSANVVVSAYLTGTHRS
ncbi:class F sortase [Streptomyces sp. NPDC060194]|uniref:class F sortase n=1 Tax=Streptomyces sp. NPDC060194 TaxID=3347069 RepID=UPI00366883C2